MERKVRILFGVCIIMMALCLLPVRADAATATWQEVDGVYYAYKGSKLVRNKWVGDYYAGEDGAMVTNQWINGTYFVGEDGKLIPDFSGGWQEINNKWYYYSAEGEKQSGFLKLGKKRYYLDPEDGCARATGWKKINGYRYYFDKSNGRMARNGWYKIKKKYYYFKKSGRCQRGWFTVKGETYYANSKYVRQTGWQTIDGNQYYLSSTGELQTGWMDISKKKRCYLDPDNGGAMSVGLVTVKRITYYFNKKGVMQKNKQVTVDGITYQIDANGKCTTTDVYDTNVTISDEMLFFTAFESGTAAYAQVGGDNGNACGKYQFDYRYSLLPFVQYCYSSDPVFFAEFKKYAAYTDSEKYKLKNNTDFYTAWRTIYNRSPEGFASYQDAFAKQEYYDVTEEYLLNSFGIDMTTRPDVVKGAVFSYSIQHGQWTAAGAVNAAGIKDSTSDEQFLEKLYNYRIKTYPSYASRYREELALALSILG